MIASTASNSTRVKARRAVGTVRVILTPFPAGEVDAAAERDDARPVDVVERLMRSSRLRVPYLVPPHSLSHEREMAMKIDLYRQADRWNIRAPRSYDSSWQPAHHCECFAPSSWRS